MEMEKMRSFVVPPEEEIGFHDDSSADDEATMRSLTDEAEAAEEILGEALSFAVSREGSLLSLESAPRFKAVEMGRNASALSLVGYDADADGDDYAAFSSRDGDSRRSVKRSVDPVFVKAPKGNPAILTQRSWDAIVEMEKDNDIGDRRLRTVLSEEQLASLKSHRKWDKLREDLENQEKRSSKGNVLKRGLKKTLSVFKRKEKSQPVKEKSEPPTGLSKSHQPALISPVSTGERSPSSDSVSEDSADFSKSSTPSSVIPQIDDLTYSSEQKNPTVNVVQTKDRSETVDPNSDDGKDSEAVTIEGLEVPLENPTVNVVQTKDRSETVDPNSDDGKDSEAVTMEGLEVPLENPTVNVVQTKDRSETADPNSDGQDSEAVTMEGLEVPLESLEFPIVESLVLQNQDSLAADTQQDDMSSNGVEDLDSSMQRAPDDISSNSVKDLGSSVQEEVSAAAELECNNAADDTRPETETDAVSADTVSIGVDIDFETPVSSPEVPIPVPVQTEVSQDDMKRETIWNILKKKRTSDKDASDNSRSQEDPPGLIQNTDNDSDDSDCTDENLMTASHHKITVETQEGRDFEETVVEESMEVEYSELGVVGVYGDVCCGILPSFGSKKA